MIQHMPFDMEAYIKQIKSNPCFICEMLSGNPLYEHDMIYQDETVVAFLNKYPSLYGYMLVAPREHREHATADFTLDEYLKLQQIIYYVAEALRKAVPTERVYILSLGSQQGNSHVHWHVAALPPGIPYEQQQFDALRLENGILSLSVEQMKLIADQIRSHIEIAPDLHRD